MRSYVKSGTVEAIRAAGGEVYGLTSEPQSLATEAEEAWDVGYPCVGDPHHEIRETLRDRGLLNVFANADAGHLWMRSWTSHPKGYFQPGVLAVDRDGRVLYRWRCRPTHDNMSGAGQRPTPQHVWTQIRSRLGLGKDAPDAPLDETPEFRHQDASWSTFVGLMLAHGWFVRVRAFPLAREGDRPSVPPQRMKRRAAIFTAAWVAAFALLPATWVAAGLVAWAAVAGLAVAEVTRQFQHIPTGEPEG